MGATHRLPPLPSVPCSSVPLLSLQQQLDELLPHATLEALRVQEVLEAHVGMPRAPRKSGASNAAGSPASWSRKEATSSSSSSFLNRFFVSPTHCRGLKSGDQAVKTLVGSNLSEFRKGEPDWSDELETVSFLLHVEKYHVDPRLAAV